MKDDGSSDDAPPGGTFGAGTCVARAALEKWAERQPDTVFAAFAGGVRWTFRDFHARVVRAAIGLQQIGARQGDHVLVWLPNGPRGADPRSSRSTTSARSACRSTPPIGASCWSMSIGNSGARLMIVHAGLAPAAFRDRHARSSRRWSCSAARPASALPAVAPFRRRPGRRGRRCRRSTDRSMPWDMQSIIYTSGTTGPSKGVLSSYLHMSPTPGRRSWPCVTADDRYMMQPADVPHRRHGPRLRDAGPRRLGRDGRAISRPSEFWDAVRRRPARPSSSCSASWRASC